MVDLPPTLVLVSAHFISMIGCSGLTFSLTMILKGAIDALASVVKPGLITLNSLRIHMRGRQIGITHETLTDIMKNQLMDLMFEWKLFFHHILNWVDV